DGAIIGAGTRIWHWTHVCAGALIGENCNIGQNVFIAGEALIGNNCKIQNNGGNFKSLELSELFLKKQP
ncbi:MAG: hypothetical protein KKB77_12755, partial [Bacteroidetes bacterium]|nr:hypothetical protein [Bacteroidota bacterium]